jgi:DNA mismatch endonuclease (patch repair protein)
MADVHDKETRSYNMSRIKSKDTKPEILVRKFLFKKGLRYRLHVKTLPGKPDLVFPKYKTCIFIHGCFWHHHKNCRKANIPKTNQAYWVPKIQRNLERDGRNMRQLRKMKWKIIIVWECQLIAKRVEKTIDALIKQIENKHRSGG